MKECVPWMNMKCKTRRKEEVRARVSHRTRTVDQKEDEGKINFMRCTEQQYQITENVVVK